jgi:rhodanese-related sulfurtransferase
MKRILFLMAMALLTCSAIDAQTADTIKFTNVSADEFLKGYNGNQDAVVIDSREYRDYKRSRIPGALHVEWPIPDEYFLGNTAPSKDKAVYIYCYAGNRSKKVCEIFYNHGYRNLYSLKGGFNGWRLSGMAVERKRLKGLRDEETKGRKR